MARDFEQESLWKRSMAKILAEEAKLSKGQRYVGNSSFFHKLSREMIREEGDRIYGAGSGIRQTCPIVPTIKNISDYETVSTLLPDPTLMPSCPHPSEKRHYTEWTPIEDAFVSLLLRQFTMNSLKTISEITNFTFHNKRNVRLPSDIKRRCGHLHSHEPQAKHRAKYHLDRIALMNSVHTKLIASKPPVVTKKLNMVAHPSHEAAARKANQNISKLLTPQELAMRRIQRTRIVTDPSGVIMVHLFTWLFIIILCIDCPSRRSTKYKFPTTYFYPNASRFT